MERDRILEYNDKRYRKGKGACPCFYCVGILMGEKVEPDLFCLCGGCNPTWNPNPEGNRRVDKEYAHPALNEMWIPGPLTAPP